MPHLPRKPLLFPLVTGASRGADGAVTLRWVQPLGRATSYAVYRFDGLTLPGRCGFADAAHLVGTTRGTSYVDTSAAAGARYTYYVTALDRLWNESPPSPPRPVAH
jgi:hypothetical protein